MLRFVNAEGGIMDWFTEMDNYIGFLQAAEAAEIFGIHKNTWFRWRQRGIISQGIRLGYRRVGWPREEVYRLYDDIRNGKVKL